MAKHLLNHQSQPVIGIHQVTRRETHTEETINLIIVDLPYNFIFDYLPDPVGADGEGSTRVTYH